LGLWAYYAPLYLKKVKYLTLLRADWNIICKLAAENGLQASETTLKT
jgi:hypothetical protein